MTKNKRLSPEEQAEIVAEVEAGEMLRKDIATKHDIHPTMISKIVQRNVKAPAKPKRKTAKKNSTRSASKDGTNGTSGTKYTEQDFNDAYDTWVSARNTANAAREKMVEIAKSL